MDKNKIKNILMTLRTQDNEAFVNNLLGRIDLLSEENLKELLLEIGNDENSIKQYFIEKLSQHKDTPAKDHIYYYSNAEKDQRESQTFSQIQSVIQKTLKLLKENNLTIYISGGTVPYLLLNEDSKRLHDDVDTICRLEDIEKLRELFKKEGLYNPEWDSKNYSQDEKDYGFEFKLDGTPFGIYPFEYKNGIITQYSFDPYNKMCKTKTIPIEQITDYIYTYESRDGKSYDTMSLEYIKLSKDNAKRPKDLADSKKISEYGIREDVMSRISMYKEVRSGGEYK